MIANINSIETIIRNILIEQSQLEPEFVRNSLSIYSTPLMTDNQSILDTLQQNQLMILFELRARNDVLNISEQDEETGIITMYQGYQAHVIIYGDDCRTLANKLIARLRTGRLNDIFRDNMLEFYSASNPESVQEYINEVMWLRTDFDIDLSCIMEIEPVSSDYIPRRLGELDFIKQEPSLALRVPVVDLLGNEISISNVDPNALFLDIYVDDILVKRIELRIDPDNYLDPPTISIYNDELIILNLDSRTTSLDVYANDEVVQNINI